MQLDLIKLRKPVYDTFNGNPIMVPQDYPVKLVKPIIQDKEYQVQTLLPPYGLVKFIASHDDLYEPKPDPIEEVTQDILTNQPLIPRIYQEYGITWLLTPNADNGSRGKILADAPGVGKTIQMTEAADRIMKALVANKDPLAYCYNTPFTYTHTENIEDQLEVNTQLTDPHPVNHPMWAIPSNEWPLTPSQDNSYRNYNPVTIISAPSHLCNMWFKHIRRQYPNDSVALCTNDTRNVRMQAIKAGCRWVIVNHEMLRPAPEPKPSDYEEIEIQHTHPYAFTEKKTQLKASYKPLETYTEALLELNAVCVIFDEFHKLKSSKSLQAQQAAELAKTIPYRFGATATPIKREADDIYMQLHIVDPWKFGYEGPFQRIYLYWSNESGYGKRDVRLTQSAKRALWANRIDSPNTDYYLTNYQTNYMNPNLKGYILARSYKDVGLYLPELIQATILVNLETDTQKVYDQIKNQYRVTFDSFDNDDEIELNSWMACMHALRHVTAASKAKLEACEQLMEDNPGPYLIFTDYDGPGHIIAKHFNSEFVSGTLIKPDDREPMILRLLSENKPIFASGRAVGTGINGLEACKTIIYLEEDWTPGEMFQRTSRVQRFDPTLAKGETKEPILCFYVNAADTLDEAIHEMQTNRSKNIRDVIKVELSK